MSAIPLGEPADVGDGKRCFEFEQRVPIPPYLLALAVGNVEAVEIGPRSKVWSEPEMVQAGAFEFAETEDFLKAAEQVAGPYVWGRYDLLLLPPSFPYGGMENPCLTFVTPTLLAGDRSQAHVVAHEIAHSWSGNLVTNKTWEHFWLNEGFTVFIERKIMNKMYGKSVFDFNAIGGLMELKETVARLGESHPHTVLKPALAGGVDPDDVFSKVPYEKGFAFLVYLEHVTRGGGDGPEHADAANGHPGVCRVSHRALQATPVQHRRHRRLQNCVHRPVSRGVGGCRLGRVADEARHAPRGRGAVLRRRVLGGFRGARASVAPVRRARQWAARGPSRWVHPPMTSRISHPRRLTISSCR